MRCEGGSKSSSTAIIICTFFFKRGKYGYRELISFDPPRPRGSAEVKHQFCFFFCLIKKMIFFNTFFFNKTFEVG